MKSKVVWNFGQKQALYTMSLLYINCLIKKLCIRSGIAVPYDRLFVFVDQPYYVPEWLHQFSFPQTVNELQPSQAWQDMRNDSRSDTHILVTTNSSLIGLKVHSSERKSVLEGIKESSQASFLELLGSWSLEKNLPPLLCYPSIAYYYILNLILVLNSLSLHCGSTNKQHKGYLNTGTKICL